MAHSIAAHGILQPLLVRAAGMDAQGDMQYRIIAGAGATRRSKGSWRRPPTRSRGTAAPRAVVISASEEATTASCSYRESAARGSAPHRGSRALKELMAL